MPLANGFKKLEISSLIRFLDISERLTGEQTLVFALVVHAIGSVTGFIVMLLFHLQAFKTINLGNLFTQNIFPKLVFYIVLTTLNSTYIFLLWKELKTRLGKFLKVYLIFNSITYIPKFALIFYFQYIEPTEGQPFTTHQIMGIFIISIVAVVMLYEILMVLKCYKRLGSRLIIRLSEHCTYRCSTKIIENQLVSVGTTNTDLDSDGCHSAEDEDGFWDQFKNRMISPFHVLIDPACLLGEGQFGCVFKGTLLRTKLKIQIAAKLVKNPDGDDTFRMILQEVKIMMSAGDHENIVKFYGVTSSGASVSGNEEHFVIITEFCTGGSLDIFLTEKRHTFMNLIGDSGGKICQGSPLLYVNLEEHGTHSTTDLVRFATEIARGMQHLASKKIIHGDLATRNVLLTSHFTVKLTDFGMSRRLYNYELYSRLENTQSLIPWRWMSIEAIQDLKFSEKSDVWSFGVVLWELFTLGQIPFEDVLWSSNIPQQFLNGLQLDRPTYATPEMYELMIQCWKIESQFRPTFSSLRNSLEEILNENL